mmetsp:Transcript_11611/g.35479  ORF Transcript_11611/g.35479 Transcript_11611/m.35479 type:complete len:599 (+) Transcript_11611:85-1881(+)
MLQEADMEFYPLPPPFVESLTRIWDELGEEKMRRDVYLRQIAREANDILEKHAVLVKRDLERGKVRLTGLRANVELLVKDVDADPFPYEDLAGKSIGEQLKLLESEKGRLISIQQSLRAAIDELRTATIKMWVETLGEKREMLKISEGPKSTDMMQAMQSELEHMRKIEDDRRRRNTGKLSKIVDLIKLFGRAGNSDLSPVEKAALQEDTSRVDRGWCESVERTLKDLEKEEVSRRVELAELVKTTFDLYTNLGITSDESAQFMEENSNVSDSAIGAWRRKIQKLQSVEQSSLQGSIDTSRTRLHELWDFTLAPESHRADFNNRADALEGQYRDLQSLYSEEVERLEKTFTLKKHIEELVEKRSLLRAKKEALDAEVADSQRLLNRRRNVPGKLLQEEKFRKEVASLPKVEAKLIKRLAEYYKLSGFHFTWNGEEMVKHIQRDEETDKMSRQARREKRNAERANRLGRSSPPTSPPLATPKRPPPSKSSESLRTPVGAVYGRLHAATVSSASKRTLPRTTPRRAVNQKTIVSSKSLQSLSAARDVVHENDRSRIGKKSVGTDSTASPSLSSMEDRKLTEMQIMDNPETSKVQCLTEEE